MTIRDDAIAIWKAGVAAVNSEALVRNQLHIADGWLHVGPQAIEISSLRHVEVVGAGKAGRGMARAAETVLQQLPTNVSVSGWVNVPADCVEQLERITLHAARPAGINEPTRAGVDGTEEILRRVAALTTSDLCLVLLSGGGSALLPAPANGVSLEDKLAVTRVLASAGAPIQDLNCVRSRLSQVKGGGLLRACRAGNMIALMISDVIGDPLDVIASGPTVPSTATSAEALEVLQRYDSGLRHIPPAVVRHLRAAPDQEPATACDVSNLVIGNNQSALTAAAKQARALGYRVVNLGSENCGDAAMFGRTLFDNLREQQAAMTKSTEPVCLLAGGETTVSLTPTDQPRRGGRNQELVLAAVAANQSPAVWEHTVLLSGGTDGEDGPTPAAGAIADADLIRRMNVNEINPVDYLAINNSFAFFERLNGLLLTGPTHTNVMDVQVGLVST